MPTLSTLETTQHTPRVITHAHPHTHALAADTPDFYLEHKSIAYFVE